MNINFDDLSEEQQEKLLDKGKLRGYSREEIIDRFNDDASDAYNVLDFFNDDNFIEQMLREDNILLTDYLDYIIDRV